MRQLHLVCLPLAGLLVALAGAAQTFTPLTSLSTGPGPVGLAVADLDGDGNLDIVTSINGSANRHITIWSGSGTGAFSSVGDFAVGIAPEGLAVADLDGDGKPDIVVANPGSGYVSILRNTSTAGAISFAPQIVLPAGGTPHQVVLADFDGDGKLDIIVTDNSGVRVLVFLNTSTPGAISFAGATSFGLSTYPDQLAVADVDGDGKLDLIVPQTNNSTVLVFRNTSHPGAATADPPFVLSTLAEPVGVTVADLNGDGKPDLIVTDYLGGYMSVFANASAPGTLAFQPRQDFPTGNGSMPTAVTAGSLGGPGHRALVVSDQGTSALSFFEAPSGGSQITFGSSQTLPLANPPSLAVLADVDHDGVLDIVALSNLGNSIAILKGAVSAYPADAATVAYWRFEDPAGTAVADETGVNPGMASGNTGVVAGKFGNARSFHSGAVGDYVTVADNPTLTNLSQITIEAWVFPATCNWYREEIVAKGAQTEPYNLYDLGAFGCPGNDGTLTFEFEMINHVTQAPGTGAVAQSPIRHPINEWYYVVGTYDGTDANLYVNGALEATGHDPGVVVTTHDPLYLHNHTFQNGQSNGRMGGIIDEVRISNVARSAGAIQGGRSSAGLGGLSITPTATRMPVGSQVTLTAAGCPTDDSTLAWSIQSGPGGSLSSASGRSVTYLASQAAGDTTIGLSAPCSASTTAVVHLDLGPAPEAIVALSPVITEGKSPVTVTASFPQPVNAAFVCVDADQVPCSARQMSDTSGGAGTSFSYSLAVAPASAGLPSGTHQVTVYGLGQGNIPGPLSTQEALTVTQQQAYILILHGYNFNQSCGPHPENWWNGAWSSEPSIACQLAVRFFNAPPSSCAAMRPAANGQSNCTQGNEQHVCVVNTLDGRAALDSTHGRCYDIYDYPPLHAYPSDNCFPYVNHPLDPSPLSSGMSATPTFKKALGIEDLGNPPDKDFSCQWQSDHWQCTNTSNEERLEEFVNSIDYLRQAETLILIGHSYGGQIARAYATKHSNVKAVFTIDTPHTGAVDLLTDLRGLFNNLQIMDGCIYDGALFNFTREGAGIANAEFPPSASPLAEIFAASSQAELPLSSFSSPIPNPAAVIAAAAETDDVVPLDSQQGGGGGQGLNACPGTADLHTGCNFHALTPYAEARLGVVPPLHTDVVGNRCSWQGLYENDYAGGNGHGLRATLEALLPHPGPHCSACTASFGSDSGCPAAWSQNVKGGGKKDRREALASQGAAPLLPPSNPLALILMSSGAFTPGAASQTLSFAADSGTDLTVTVSAANSNPDLVLVGPGSQTLTPASADGLTNLYSAAFAGGTTTKTLVFRRPAPGGWTLQLAVPNSGSGPNLPATGGSWQASVAMRSPVALSVAMPQLSYLIGDAVNVEATLLEQGVALPGGTVSALVTPDDGSSPIALTLYDDGAHGDGAAGDGIYGGTLVAGSWTGAQIVVSATGQSPGGAFQRQAATHISVFSAQAAIAGPFAESAPDNDGDGSYDSLGWSFGIQTVGAGDFSVVGDLISSDGTVISHASTPLAVGGAGVTQATLVFAGQDIYASGKLGPYTLTNVQVFLAASNGQALVARGTQLATSTGPYWSWLNFQAVTAPSILWLFPSVQQVTSSNAITLRWKVQDGNGGTTVDLFYDTVGGGFSGTPIVTGLAVANGAMTYAWDVSSLPDGTYYVYARARNGSYSNAVYGGAIVRMIDTDGDGMPDAWELAHGLNPNDPSDALKDADGDGLANVDEYMAGTDPQKADTDGGGESDLSELVNGRDPLNPGDDLVGVSISRIVPPEGDNRGGDTILVLGSGFQSGATVSFGGTAAAGVTYANSTRLLVVTPAHGVGLVDLTVTNPGAGGSASRPGGFTFLCQFVESPVVTSNGPLCPGQTLQLSSTGLAGGSFSWTGPNGFSATAQNPSLPSAAVAASGIYTVTETVGQCAVQGSITVFVGPGVPVAANGGPLCAGQDLQLTATTVAGATYQWTGPGGFSSTSQNPLISAAQPAASGTYSVTAAANGCISPPAATSVLVRTLPTALVSGSSTSCEGVPNTIQAALTGTAPWNVVWSDGASQPGLAASPATRSVQPTVGTTYTVTSVSDAYCQGASSGNAVIAIDGTCAQFFTLPPCRLADTRTPVGPLGGPSLQAGSVRGFPLTGVCGIPAAAKAVAINVTITQPTASGDLRLYPNDVAMAPRVSTINWVKGQTRANNAVVELPGNSSGIVDVKVDGQGTVHFILDVTGYFE